MTDSSSMTKTPPTMPEILVSATRYASAPMQQEMSVISCGKGLMGWQTMIQGLILQASAVVCNRQVVPKQPPLLVT